MDGAYLEIITHTPFWLYLSFPFVAAAIGWLTNWAAVQLLFYPREFVGKKPYLGWQGVIPAKAGDMASICVDKTIEQFGHFGELFQRLDPEALADHMIRHIEPRLEEIIDEVMQAHHDVLWENLPQGIRNRVYAWGHKQLPIIIDQLIDDFGDQMHDLIDPEELFIEPVQRRPELMSRIFLEVGAPEFRFVIASGRVMGFFLGMGQMVLWHLTDSLWWLPLSAVLVGLLTNWLALTLIFRPVEPVPVLGMSLQGLFMRRQDEVADVWSRVVASELLTVEQVVQVLIHGRNGHRTQAIIRKNLKPIIEESAVFKLMAQIALGAKGYAELKQALGDKALSLSHDALHDNRFNQGKAQVLADMMASKMKQLPAADFQAILRPAFQQDEWLLVALGGMLGGMIGLLQVLFWL